MLKRMLPPNNVAIRQLSKEEGISEATLHKWRSAARGKEELLPDADVGPEGWSSRDKFAAVLETAPSMRLIWPNIAANAGSTKHRLRHGGPLVNKQTTGIVPAQHVSVGRPRMGRNGARIWIWSGNWSARTAHWPKPQRFWGVS